MTDTTLTATYVAGVDAELIASAAPLGAAAERGRLQDEFEAVFPMLWKMDTSASLAALLKLIARARELGATGLSVLHAFAKRLRANRAFDDLYILTSEVNSAAELRFDIEALDLEAAKAASDQVRSETSRNAAAAMRMRLDLRRWEVQALIELGVYETALTLAQPLAAHGPLTRAGEDGLSAVGRIYKQMFADGARAKPPVDQALLETYLLRSFSAYNKVWKSRPPTHETAYYGVNALAVAARAAREGAPIPGVDTQRLSNEVLNAFNSGEDAWSAATMGEAYIALGQHAEAARCYARFVFRKEVDLFQLNSALRQLEEIWGLDGKDPSTGGPVRVLKTAILARMNADTEGDPEKDVSTGDGRKPRTREASEIRIEASEARLIADEAGAIEQQAAADKKADDEKAKAAQLAGDPKGYERVFAANAPFAVGLLRQGLERARSVCRIDCFINGERRGFGTGFAIVGRLLHESWGDQVFIITNSHVISATPNGKSQAFSNCEAVFVNPADDSEIRVEFEGVEWESNQDAHDVTILRPRGPIPMSATPISRIAHNALPPRADSDEGVGRVYVIGFPMGGPLAFSFADNILLDHDARPGMASGPGGEAQPTFVPTPEPVRLHYKAPTLGGSSGSPVFDFNRFELLAVHHRGLPNLPRLPQKSGEYAANQGIWIESIRAAITETLAESDAAEAGNLSSDVARRWRALRRPTGPRPPAGEAPPWAASDNTAAGAPAASTTPGAEEAPPLPAPPPPRPAPAPPPPKSIALGGSDPQPAPAPEPQRTFWRGSIGDVSLGSSSLIAEVMKTGRASQTEVLESSNESVIGIDSRVRLRDTHLSPWRMICAIRSHWGAQLEAGTGFLVGPNLVLTAGHVVFPKRRRAPPSRIEIIFGLDGDEPEPFGKAEGARIVMHERWPTDFDFACDVAGVYLTQPVGKKLGWFGVAARPKEDLRSTWAHVTGYPAADARGQQLSPDRLWQLMHHRSPVVDVRDGRVFYATDTTAGQSGAPIYLHEPAVSPTPVVVGVHAYGERSTPSAIGAANSGPWIDDGLFERIRKWREEAEQIAGLGPMS